MPGQTTKRKRTAAVLTAAVCSAAAAIALTLTSPVAHAQEPDKPAAPAQQPPAAAATTATAQDMAADDIALLVKAVQQLQTGAYEIDSDLTVSATVNGATLRFAERLKVVGKFPTKFRADLQAEPNADGTPGTKYLVVGDGAKAWISRPGTGEYAVRPVVEFNGDFPVPAQGILGGLFAGMKGNTSSPADPKFIEEIRKDGGSATVADGTLANGTLVRVLTITSAPKDGFALRLHIDPKTARIGRAELTAKPGQDKSGDMQDLSMVEVVRAQSGSPLMTPETFRFTPPAGAKKVDKISIGPF